MLSRLSLLLVLAALVGGPASMRAQESQPSAQADAQAPAQADAQAPAQADAQAPAGADAAAQALAPGGAEADQEQLWAEAQRMTLPAWTARGESARAQQALADAYFAGTERLDVAFPEVASGPMARIGWLDSMLAQQTKKDLERARERARPVPEFGVEERASAWRLARSEALWAEEAAAAGSRRLVLALRSLAAEHPRLGGAGYVQDRDALAAEVAVLDALVRGLEEGPARDTQLGLLHGLQTRAAALDALAARARRAVTVEGAASPLDRADLTRLTEPDGSAAADRLDRVQSVLGAKERATVNAALIAWLEVAVPEVQAQLKVWNAGGAPSAELPRDLWPVCSDTPPPTELRKRVCSLHEARATALSQISEVRANRRHDDRATREAADKASQRAEAARRDATEAASRVTDESSRQLAELLGKVAQAEASSEQAWSETRAAAEAFVVVESEWADTLRRLNAEVDAVLATPAGLGSNRRERGRDAWADLHQELTTLRRAALASIKNHKATQVQRDAGRAAVALERAELESARSFVSELPNGPARAGGEAALAQWESALASRNEAIAQARESAEARRDATFGSLREEKMARERLRPALSGADRAPRDTLFRDIELELRLFVPNVLALARRRMTAILELPLILADLDRLVGLVISSFWLVLLLVGGFWTRARVPGLVTPAVLRLGRQERRLFQRDFSPLVKPVNVVAVAALDLFVLSLLLAPVRARVPELAILLVLVRIGVLFRLVDGAFRLAVAPQSEHRPALVAVNNQAWPLVSRAERLLLLWMLLGTLVQYVVRDLIGAEALAWLTSRAFLFAFLGLAVFLLHLAEPYLRVAVTSRAPDGRLKAYLGGSASFFTRAPRAAVGGLWLVTLRIWQVVQGNVEEGSLLGRFLNVVNRRRLSQTEEDVAVPPLPPEVVEKLSGRVTAESARLLYSGAIAEIDSAFEGWRTEQSRGMVLIVGDRGQGKRVFVPDWASGVAGLAGLELKHARLTGRILTEHDLLAQLGRLLEIPNVTDADSLRASLEELPPTLFVLEHIQQAFLRRVGGFRALHALLRSLAPSCSRHFWLLAVHAPAWRLLERFGTVVNSNTFRAVVELPRIGGGDLQKFLLGRTEQQGLTVDFGPLSNATAAGQPAAERERTAEAFFRLLAESAGGNPRAAVSLWVRSLYPGATETELKVRLPDAISNPKLPPLTDPALLILAAVRVHGGLTLQEIRQVNNMDFGLVQTTVQVLENLALLEQNGEYFHIHIDALASITGLLRRRHFVYGKDIAR